uniref:Uncharacterized protein n=1 Tax=Rousettus aegyptiacus TaxID=9407 RepID=A0A7J8GC18_ROUAE|nr:hypothetical protein HJG63_011628 [Rousettus aegyptiacus]
MKLHQTKKFLYNNRNINKTKRQPTEREKIFVNDTSDKELISKIYKELIQLNSNKTVQLKKWVKDLNRHFQGRHVDGQQIYENICSTSVIIKEVQIKTTVRYYLTLVGMAILNKTKNNKCWKGCGERGKSSHTPGGNVHLCSHYRKQYGDFSKN